MKLLASSHNIDGIKKLIEKFFYSKNISLKEINPNEWKIYGLKGLIEGVRVVFIKNRYRFEMETQEKNKINGKSEWEKLIEPHKPKETENDEYVIDKNSSGIYTPVLEGIAKLNPSRFKLNHYITIASNLEKEGDHALESNQYETALRSYSKAFVTSLIGTHVDFMSKAEVKPVSKTVENLYQLHDTSIVYSMIRQSNKRFQLKKILLDRGMSNLVTKIEKEFNLYNPTGLGSSPSQAKNKKLR